MFMPMKFCQIGEVDQELECEMHQTEHKKMIGCDMDWPPWRIPILFTLAMRIGKSRETYLKERRQR